MQSESSSVGVILDSSLVQILLLSLSLYPNNFSGTPLVFVQNSFVLLLPSRIRRQINFPCFYIYDLYLNQIFLWIPSFYPEILLG
jgi:hypothetical protein